MVRRCLIAFALPLLACAAPPATPEIETRHGGITTTNAIISNAIISNAIISNAIISNAIISNALSSNALSSNALSSNALSSNAIRPDGITEGALARQFLSYVYSCAMPAGAEMALTIAGNDYGTLRGGVGLAPEWGRPGGRCDDRCQRLITGCLLARTNFWGVPVQISLRGPSPALVPTAAEKAEFGLREGAYFGNLFVNGGAEHLFACAGPGSNLPQLTRRFCSGATGPCAIKVVYDCVDPAPHLTRNGVTQFGARFACQRQDPNDGAVLDCWTGGISIYGDQPQGKHFSDVVTVYLREPVTVCGDGVCAAEETPASCPADCSRGWARALPGLRNQPILLGSFADGDLELGVISGDSTDFGGGPVKILPGEEASIFARLGPDGRDVRWTHPLTVGSSYTTFPAGPSVVDRAGNSYVAIGHFEPMWLERELLSLLPGMVTGLTNNNVLVVKLGPDGRRRWARRFLAQPYGFMLDAGDRPIALLNVPTGQDASTARAEVLDPRDGQTLASVDLPPQSPGSFLGPVVVNAGGRMLLGEMGFAPPSAVWLDLATGAVEPAEVPEAPFGNLGQAARTPDGGVALLGTFGTPDGGFQIELIRYDAEGHLLWHRPLTRAASGTPLQTNASSVAVSPAGDIAVLGAFSTPLDLDNDVFVPSGYQPGSIEGTDIWVARYDAAGQKRWARQLGGGGYDWGFAVLFDAADRVVVTGTFAQTGIFDGRVLDNPYGGGNTASLRTFIVAIP